MESIFELRDRLREGAPLRVIFYAPSGAVAINAKLSSVQPLVLKTEDSNALMATAGSRAMLIVNDRSQYVKAEADVINVERGEGGISVSLSDRLWEVVDRRRYPRYRMNIPITIRTITEGEFEQKVTEVNGFTDDISIGGAWTVLEKPLEQGTLVEFQANLEDGSNVRMLSVVAHAGNDGQGYGVEFLDYIGSARYLLHDYLSRAA
ncbi:MAG: PilZ domain-containing protein [Armatimonadetes bacterium]|nr:PilZ domain-containing protein [Armatimonadota bacterium]